MDAQCIFNELVTDKIEILFKFASIHFKSGPVNTRQESSAYRRRSHSTELDMSFTYKRKFRGPRIDPCGTPQVRSPGGFQN